MSLKFSWIVRNSIVVGLFVLFYLTYLNWENIFHSGGDSFCNLTRKQDSHLVWIPEMKHEHDKLSYIQQPSSCLLIAAPPEMVLLISSRPTSFVMRNSIRSTWGVTAAACGVKIVFGFGFQSNGTIQKLLSSENKLNKDILQFKNIPDSYRSQTRIVLAFYEWTVKFCNVRYIAKADDDVWINLPRVLSFVESIAEINYLAGYIFPSGNLVNRHPNHPQSLSYKERLANRFPAYSSGIFYLFPAHLLPLVLQVSKSRRQYWIDDAFISGDVIEQINLNTSVHRILRIMIPGYAEKLDFSTGTTACKLLNATIIHRAGPNLTQFLHNLPCLAKILKCHA